MAPIHHITSTAQFKSLLSTHTYLVADFYADWCGPCKMIAPIFEQLAASEAQPGKLAFAKVDVDSQQGLAREYGVSAMPTFLILKSGSVTQTIRGANPPALRAAILKASADAKAGPGGQSVAFSGKGHVLGTNDNSSSSTASRATGTTGGFPSFNMAGGAETANTATRFIALYLTSLFSLDAYKAAEESPFAIRNAGSGSGGRTVG